MQELAFWKAVIVDESNFLETMIALLAENHIQYCVIGGHGVNAYVDPLVGLDLDLVVMEHQVGETEELLHLLDSARVSCRLRVQIQTDPRYSSFVGRARTASVLGVDLPVAALEDILQGKIWAAQDPTRRPSKRRKDLLDIERIVDDYPNLRQQVPYDILERLEA